MPSLSPQSSPLGFLAFSTITTLAIITLYNIDPKNFDTYISAPLIVSLIVALGIPHGALDHLLFQKLCLLAFSPHKTKRASALPTLPPSRASISEKTSVESNLERLARVAEDRPDGISRKGTDSTLCDVNVNEDPRKLRLKYHGECVEQRQTLNSRIRSFVPWIPHSLSSPAVSVARKLTFYTNYFAIMAMWGFLWGMAPISAFCSFLAVSAYHFGQGDLHYLGDRSPLPIMLYISRGILLLGALVTSRPEITYPIIKALLAPSRDVFLQSTSSVDPHEVLTSSSPIDNLEWLLSVTVFTTSFWKLACVGQHFIILAAHSVLDLLSGAPTLPSESKWRNPWVKEIFRSSLMTLLFLSINPLVAFAIYFGLWHSLHSIVAEIAFLKSPDPKETVEASGVISASGALPHLNIPDGLVESIMDLDQAEGTEREELTDEIQWGKVTNLDVLRFLILSSPYTLVAVSSIAVFYVFGGYSNFMASRTSFAANANPYVTHIPLFNDSTCLALEQNAQMLNYNTDSTSPDAIPLAPRLWSVFLIGISVLTGPHMWIMQLLHGSEGEPTSNANEDSQEPVSPLKPSSPSTPTKRRTSLHGSITSTFIETVLPFTNGNHLDPVIRARWISSVVWKQAGQERGDGDVGMSARMRQKMERETVNGVVVWLDSLLW